MSTSVADDRRAWTVSDVVVYLVGVVGLAAAVTLIFLGMRAVMAIGGACAEGGPYEISQPCPEGVPVVMMVSFPALFLFGGVILWRGARIGANYAMVAALAWPALFLSLGWNFLEFAVSPALGADGIVWGWLIPGVLFVLMGGLPLLLLLPGRRGTLASTATTGRLTTPRASPTAPTGDGDGPPRASVSGFVDELERLARLRSDGALSEAEFQQAKRRLLSEEGAP